MGGNDNSTSSQSIAQSYLRRILALDCNFGSNSIFLFSARDSNDVLLVSIQRLPNGSEMSYEPAGFLGLSDSVTFHETPIQETRRRWWSKILPKK